MGLNDKHNNADGKDPDFGAIFMSSSETKRECFKKGLFGLPSTEIQFVEQVKAGMILFLYEYEKRQLHGVFKASCDGGINIVPNAFAKVGKQFPAQVKFDPIWFCKPLPEKLFRDAIRENYFSANKFNFGLSENQVHKLIYLFSQRKLEPELPGRPLSRAEYLKSERYPLGNVGRSVDHGMQIERVQSGQGLGGNISPVIMHEHQGDSLDYNGEVEYTGLNASDIKRARAAQFAAVDNKSEYVCDYSGLKDESRFIAYENEDYMNICHRPNIIGGYPKSLPDKIRIHDEGSLSISDRLMNKSLPETDQRMVFSSDVHGLRNSHINPSGFYSNPILEHNSLVQNQLRPTSTMTHPMQPQLNNTCATQGSANSTSTSLLYDQDVPNFNFSQASSFGVIDGSKPIIERITPSNNFGRNSLSSQPYLIRNNEMKDMSRWHTVDFQNSLLYSSNRDCKPLNTVQNSDQLAAESVVYEACDDVPSLKSLSSPIPPDIGKCSRSLHEPFSSLFHNHQPWSENNFLSTTLQENPNHEITLQKINETFTPDISWANEGHFKDDDPLIYEYDIGCYGVTQNHNSGYQKQKSSVFSRLSFMQDINKQDVHNDFHTSVDEVMERVRQSHNKWMTKRKSKPKRNRAESLRDKTQVSSLRMKEGDFFENTLNDQIMDLTTATRGNANKTAEDTCFVDFKRRSKVRKPSAENENSVLGQQKRRKLIRPTFSKSLTSDYKGIDLDASQNVEVESCNVENVKESCCEVNTKADAEVRNIVSETRSEDKNSSHARGYADSDGGERASNSALAVFNDKSECLDNIKADTDVQNIIGGAHSEDKKTSPARGYVCGEGGEKAIDGALTAFSDESKCLENVNNNVFSSSSCKGNKGLCTMDSIKPVSLNSESSRSICQEHHVHEIACAGRGTSTGKEMLQDCCSSVTIEVKDGPGKVAIETCAPIKECLHGMDSLKQASAGTDSLRSICQEQDTGKIVKSRGSNCKEQMSRDGGSFVAGVKDGFDCLLNSDNENALIVPSFFKEGLSMTESQKSVCADSESLPSICRECSVEKVRCAGRAIKTEDCRSPVTTEVKDGSDGSKKSGYTCEQKMI